MYEPFYKLTAKPFRLSPDPRFFYNSKGHKRALAYLRYGIRQGEGFIVVTGDVGTGKSTLVSALFEALKRENVVAAQIVTTQIEGDDLLRMVSASFGLPYQDISKGVLLRNLEVFFRACANERKRVLLVIDEAQGLPHGAIEELRMLSNFQMNGRSLLQSFLLGQREFRATMRSEGFEQLRQRVIAAYHLKPLDADETRGYIEHRLRRAGWKNDPVITPDVYPGIHQFTGGVPRRVNTLCDRLLLFGYLEDKHTLDLKALRTVASDILEEHGDPGLEHAEGFDAAPAVGGDDWYEQDAVAPVQDDPSAQDAGAASGAPAPAGDGAERFAAMEHSMASLTEAVRSELSAIKEALKLAQAGAAASPGADSADPAQASQTQPMPDGGGGDTVVEPAEPARAVKPAGGPLRSDTDTGGTASGGTGSGGNTLGNGAGDAGGSQEGMAAQDGDESDSDTKTEPDPPMFLASRRS